MATYWTSELIPSFLKQLITVSFATVSQESVSIFIACKIEIFE